ncbi:MAG: KEOPS complex subunit Pcc1 [Halobacteriaceae archaeon]
MSERRARVRTAHDDPETVAAALRPDDTPSMTTRVENGGVVAEMARDRTGGLRSTLDDHLVNLRVAARVARRARELDDDANDTETDTDTHDT